MRSFVKVDPTEGRIVPAMLLYALPIMIGSILQTLFTATDLVVVRMMADSTAVASIGATSTVTSLLVSSVVGISSGVNIVLARLVGAKENERIRRMIPTSLITALALGIVVCVCGLCFSTPLLRLIDCPDDCFVGAQQYLIVYVSAAPFIMVYNFAAAVIRVDGDSTRPTLYLVIAGLVNVVLNFVLCFMLENKVLAVAFATAASQIVGAILSVGRLMRIEGACRFSFRTLSFDGTLCKKIFIYGLPSAITNATFGISNVQVQGAVNSYGSSAIAGNTACVNLENLVASFQNGLFSSIGVFMGQNIGAQKAERVKKSFLWGTLVGVAGSLVFSNIIYLLRDPMLAIYVGDDTAAIEMGVVRMVYVLQFYFIFAARGAFNSGLSAFGYSKFTMVNSLLSIVVFRMLWMSFVYPLNPCPDMVYLTYLISGILGLIIVVPMFLVVYIKFKRGKLRKI